MQLLTDLQYFENWVLSRNIASGARSLTRCCMIVADCYYIRTDFLSKDSFVLVPTSQMGRRP